jgi:hypothetical protein
MKEPKTNPHTQPQSKRDQLDTALRALKIAIVEGASWRYEHLVQAAVQLGATDEDIDGIAHQALEALLSGAEQPLTARDLPATWSRCQSPQSRSPRNPRTASATHPGQFRKP